MKIKHPLSKKEVKKIMEEMARIFGEEVAEKLISKNDQVLVGEFDKTTQILFVNGKPRFIRREKLIFPLVITLYEISDKEDLRKWKRRVVVDQGAVPYILNGADVMAPGIVDADEGIKESDFVFVVEEEYGRPLAIGIALMDGKTMKEKKKGKAVKVIHHAKDKIWELTAV
ncbi:RNA-binding protein [Thermococcus litoralis DSM 5473]|uniref:RNA-binding protein n=1 Tax=Thermococcus litoralis (strain ATCC 51850 / DSM 5473 / JCM 8560 / NS-C) TaxID=523849 RepID=H3ZK97_THELN|nr:RNA-binding protein [Thermococcus litoralis]EHR79650.1 RNA-binding protein [Thermococcus litoralis DSM 5473]